MSDTGSTPSAPAPADGLSSNAKLIALLGWIFAPLGVIAIFLDDYKNDRFVRSNVIQAAGLWLAGYVVGFVLSFIVIGVFVFPIVFIIQIVYGIQAFNGKSPQVPVIYGVVEKMIDQV